MMIALYKQARTTPAVRAEIAASNETLSCLAARLGITPATVYKWKGRTSTADLSHTAHRLQTTLTTAQEAIVVELRKLLLLLLDDLLAISREFICPQVSRSGLDRCLQRHGVGSLHALKPATPKQPHKAFKAYEPGYLHMDIKYLCLKWRMRAAGATSSWPSTALRAGCLLPSSPTRPPPAPAAS